MILKITHQNSIMAQNSDDDYMPPEDEIRREILSSIKRKSKQPKKAKIIEDDPVKEVLKKNSMKILVLAAA